MTILGRTLDSTLEAYRRMFATMRTLLSVCMENLRRIRNVDEALKTGEGNDKMELRTCTSTWSTVHFTSLILNEIQTKSCTTNFLAWNFIICKMLYEHRRKERNSIRRRQLNAVRWMLWSCFIFGTDCECKQRNIQMRVALVWICSLFRVRSM